MHLIWVISVIFNMELHRSQNQPHFFVMLYCFERIDVVLLIFGLLGDREGIEFGMELGLPEGKELGNSLGDWLGLSLGPLLGDELDWELGSTGTAGGLNS